MKRTLLLAAAFTVNAMVCAQSFSYINANNINARVSCANPWFFNPTSSGPTFEAPSGSGKQTIYASGLWMGGKDFTGALKLSGALYSQNGTDFQPGPVSDNSAYPTQTLAYDRIWKVHKSEVTTHVNNYNQIGYTIPADIATWPAHGDTTIGQAWNLAPFVDTDNDGIYIPSNGDYPSINGDVSLFYIMNDDKIHTETAGDPIRAEIHVMAYSLNCAADSALNNTVFLNLKIINRSTQTLYDFGAGIFTDGDIGCANNDYTGCDVSRSMSYFHNATAFDSNCNGAFGYDSVVPYQGIAMLGGLTQDNDAIDNGIYTNTTQALANNGIVYPASGMGFNDGIIDNERLGMTGFIYFVNASPSVGFPSTAQGFYNYLNGYWLDGTNLYYSGNGYYTNAAVISAGSVPTNYMFTDNSDPLHWSTSGVVPTDSIPWNEFTAGFSAGDRRSVTRCGNITFQPGDVHNIDIAYIFARNYQTIGDSGSHALLNIYTDSIHSYFRNNQSPCGAFLYSSLSANEIKNNIQVSVYPNPVENIFTISTASQEKMKYTMYDVSGSIVTSGSFRQLTTVNISSLAAGVYMLHASTPQGVTVAHKIIKQ